MACLHLLAYLIFTSCLVAGKSPKYALRGMGHHFKLDIFGRPITILWTHNGKKVVEFNSREEHVYSPYEDRITLNRETAELEITGLRFEDSGDYELEVDINHSLYSSHYKLEVIDKVTSPTISCEMNEGNSSDVSKTKAMLLCSAETRTSESLMKFEWMSKGKTLHLGPKLTISLGDKLDEEEYTCLVSNPLSSETATFTARECYPGKSSSAALAACLSILFLLLLGTVVAGIVFCKLRQKVCFAQNQSNDSKRQSQTEVSESDKKTAPTEEERHLLQSEKTHPSHQPLVHDHISPDHPDDSRKENTNSGVDTGEANHDVHNTHDQDANQLKEPADVLLPENSDTEKANNQERASKPEESGDDAQSDQEPEEASQSDHSESEGNNESDPAGVQAQSPEGSKSDEGQHEEIASTPSSPSNDSPSQQDPRHSPNISEVDLQLKKPAEVSLLDPSHTEETNIEDRASTPKESIEEAQSDLKPEDAQKSDHSDSEGNNESGPVDVSGQSEDEQSALKPAPQLPGSESTTGENKEQLTPSSSEPSSSQEQGHHQKELLQQDPSELEAKNTPVQAGVGGTLPEASHHGLYKHDQDANQLKEPAEVLLSDSSDTEEANNLDRAGTSKESSEDAHSDRKSEEAQQSDHSDSEGNN